MARWPRVTPGSTRRRPLPCGTTASLARLPTRGDDPVDALPDGLVGERELDVACADEREPPWRHLLDLEDARVPVDRRGDRGLREDRRVRARGDEVADEPDALDLDRHAQGDALRLRERVELDAQRVAERREHEWVRGERAQGHG